MKYQYKVKNFRVFDAEGVKLDMAPITILTGCNSSGKSSLVKSMLLVNKVLKKMSRSGKPNLDLKLDFTETPNSLLGSFDNVIHRGSLSKEITIEYTVPSLFLNEDVVVSMTFTPYGKYNGAVLDKFFISRPNGDDIFYCKCICENYHRFTETFCCQDLRKSFYRYAFVVNNSVDLDIFMNDNSELEMMQSKKEKYYDVLANLKEIEAYYLSNKDWIDKIRPEVFRPLVPSDEKYTYASANIGVTNEQIYKENLLYTPILEKLFVTNKNDFLSFAESIVEKCTDRDQKELALFLAQFVDKEFQTSEYNEFPEYFDHIINEFFCSQFDLNDSYRNKSLSGRNRLIGCPIEMEEMKVYCSKNVMSAMYNLIIVLTGITESKSYDETYSSSLPNWYVSYYDFINLVVKEILSYRLPTENSYIPTSNVVIKRLYSFDEKDEMTVLLKDYIRSKTENSEGMSWAFANRWLKKLNIGQKVSIKALVDSAGCEVRIYQENDEEGQLLADFGYGISQLIFLLLRIEIEGTRHYPMSIGATYLDYEEEERRKLRYQYGKPSTIMLEEPEVHLHPKFQSMIADILLDAYNTFNFHFIVETHSEYLIRRSQVLVSKMGFKNNVESVEKSPFITYYIPEDSKPYSLGYRKDGKFMESFGTGFYDEASNLSFELL